MKNNNCPECNYHSDAATALDGDYKPSDGDISLCFNCGAINQFDSELNIIPLPDIVLASIKEHEPETHEQLMDAVISIKANNMRLN